MRHFSLIMFFGSGGGILVEAERRGVCERGIVLASLLRG